jgi:hypothetical protein
MIQKELDSLGDAVSSGNRALIEKYVFTNTVMDYVEKLIKTQDIDIVSKVVAVKREVDKFWSNADSSLESESPSLPIV